MAAEKLSSYKEPYLDELLIRLATNAILRKELERKNILKTKALFKLQRDFYRELLKRGPYVDYSLYQLSAMGDEDQSYLWWYTLNPL